MRLTPGELAWLLRRREGQTAVEAANEYGVSRETLRAVERDELPTTAVYSALPASASPLTPGEFSAIARRRAGLTLEQVARKRRTTKMTIYKQEFDRTTTAPELAMWWIDNLEAPRKGKATIIADLHWV